MNLLDGRDYSFIPSSCCLGRTSLLPGGGVVSFRHFGWFLFCEEKVICEKVPISGKISNLRWLLSLAVPWNSKLILVVPWNSKLILAVPWNSKLILAVLWNSKFILVVLWNSKFILVVLWNSKFILVAWSCAGCWLANQGLLHACVWLCVECITNSLTLMLSSPLFAGKLVWRCGMIRTWR